MPVHGLQHVNIRTPDLEGTLAFFRDVLLMRPAPSPNRTSMEDGAWIFDANDQAVVHVARIGIPYPSDEVMPFRESRGSGALHHVALQCSDFDGTLARIKALGLEFYENQIPQMKLRQLFVSDPNGIVFELNFAGE
jgi:catechol 2,3-dioxygenase-like lactoylglutathione lyase family enzyme